MQENTRIQLAQKSLKGISIGDAFGESFFGERKEILKYLSDRKIPPTSWEFTDDTVMSIAIFEQLKKHQTIIQNELAKDFAVNHELDVNRGYGATARRILREIHEGKDWREISRQVFEGMGSMGNGASMRVGPIGSYYFDDLDTVVKLATKSAEVTHSNIEGITGAIAVALGTAIATRSKISGQAVTPDDFIKEIVSKLPESDTKYKVKKSLSVPYTYRIETIESILGNGSKIMAKDTVPFAIWCAAHHLNHFAEALWKAVSILGDRDTICAIVGGITIMSSSEESIPKDWVTAVENIETSVFWNKDEK